MLAMAGSQQHLLLTEQKVRPKESTGQDLLQPGARGKGGDPLPKGKRTFVSHGRTLESAKGMKPETVSTITLQAVADKVKVPDGPKSNHVPDQRDEKEKVKGSTVARLGNPSHVCIFRKAIARLVTTAISPTMMPLPLPQKAVVREAKGRTQEVLAKGREMAKRRMEASKIFSRGGSKP